LSEWSFEEKKGGVEKGWVKGDLLGVTQTL